MHPVHKLLASTILALTAVTVAVRPASAAPGEIERIDVQGLSRMDLKSFMYLFGVKVGDPYDEQRLRERFRALWEGERERLFEDITIEAEDGPEGGRVVILKVRERPILSAITYDESKVLTKTEIEDHFKERQINLRVGQALDRGQVYFAEAAIRDLFAQKGFLDATVESEISEATTTTRVVHFTMTPGGKTRIRRIQFTGNEVMKDRKLKKLLQQTQERRWYWPWSSKNLYHPIKWDQDIAKVRDAYQNLGHLDVEIHAPIVEVRRSKKAERKAKAAAAAAAESSVTPPAAAEPPPAPSPAPAAAEVAGAGAEEETAQAAPSKRQLKHERRAEKRARKQAQRAKKKQSKRWVFLTVPVTEGPSYRLGEISFSGNEVFQGDVLRPQIRLESGDVLNMGLVKLGMSAITRMYEDRGYLYANVVQVVERHEDRRSADVTVTVKEDRPYRVGRIEFHGNTATQDRVLRREVQLAEGDLFGRTKLNLSRLKINQLGYFQVPGEPVIEPIGEEDRVRVTFDGIEQGRNEIQVGGGFSGLEGAFFSGVYSTRNFLGRGQVVSTALQIGGRSNRYQISFQEPWFLGRPLLFGISLFRREQDYGEDLESTSTGGQLTLGRRLGNFSSISGRYNYEEVESDSIVGDTVLETRYVVSSITPIYVYSTVNNPYRPTRGTAFSLSTQLAGGALGGSVSFIKPLSEFTRYQRAFGRSLFAFHGEGGLVREVGSLDVVNSSDVEGVPRVERFWLGGDTQGPRVFETRSITPRRFVRVENGVIVEVVGDITGRDPSEFVNVNGVPVPIEVGGDRMYLVQTEWVLPFNEQAEMALFFDAGDALFEDTNLDFTTIRASTGVELRFHLPIFPVPLRLIYGWPVREIEGDSTSSFTFSIGRSF